MGGNISQPQKFSAKKLASFVSSCGPDYQQYVTEIKDNAIDGDFLADLSEKEFLETLDDLSVTNNEHREHLLEKFQTVFLKAQKRQQVRRSVSFNSARLSAVRKKFSGTSERMMKSNSTGSMTASTVASTVMTKRSSIGSFKATTNMSNTVSFQSNSTMCVRTLASLQLMVNNTSRESLPLPKKEQELDAEQVKSYDYCKTRRGPSPSSGLRKFQCHPTHRQ